MRYPVFLALVLFPGYNEAKALIASRTSIGPNAIFRLHPRWKETDKYCVRTRDLKFTSHYKCRKQTRAKYRTAGPFAELDMVQPTLREQSFENEFEGSTN